MSNGGPAPDAATNTMFENTKSIQSYNICPDLQVNKWLGLNIVFKHQPPTLPSVISVIFLGVNYL